MAEVNFGTDPAKQGENQAATPAVNNPNTAVQKPSAQAMGDYIPTADQIILPRINIVQGVGKLKDSFPQGAIVMSQQLTIFKQPVRNAQGEVTEAGSKPLIVTCCGFKPVRYVEMVQGGGRGAIYNTEAEVAANSGTLDYQTWNANKATMKRFSPYTEGMFLIEKPVDLVSESFPYVIDGKQHAIVLWALKGTAYTAACKRTLFTERQVGCLQKGGYPSMTFALSTKFEKWGENGAWIPVLLQLTKSSEERMKFAHDFLSSGASSTSEEDAD